MRFRIRFLPRFQSRDDRSFTKFFIEKFGYKPVDIKLFHQAVTHRSLSHSQQEDHSNERLEFLGDAILDAVVAEFLFSKFPNEDEGYLTKVKSKVVSRKSLSDIAGDLNVREILRYNKGRSININSLEGNAFEAIIGAIYLDSSYDVVKNVIRNHIFRKYVDLNKILEEEIDFKSKLFIWSQKKRLQLEFAVVSEENVAGVWTYEIEVKVNGKKYGRGIGSSKKLAEQAAAKETLELMGED